MSSTVQRRTLMVLALAQIVGGVGNGAGLTAASLLIRELSGSTRSAGLAVVMVTLGASALSIPLARRAGVRGRRAALALGWSLGSAGSATTLAGAVTGALPLLCSGWACSARAPPPTSRCGSRRSIWLLLTGSVGAWRW